MRARTRCEFAAVMLRAQEGTLPSEEEREGDEEDGDGNQADPGGAPPWHYRSTVSSLRPGSSTHLLSLRTPPSDLHGRRDLGSCFIHSALSKTEPFNIEGPRLQF